MRDVLAILGAVLAIVALTMSLVVFRRNFGGEEDASSLLRRLVAAENRADHVKRQQDELAERIASISRTITDIEEKTAANPAALAARIVNEEVEKRVSAAVQDEMNRRLKETSPPSPVSAAQAAAQKSYDAMLASFKKSADIQHPADARIDAAFEKARAALNFLAVEMNSKVITREELDNGASQIRAELEKDIRKILGDKYADYEKWKQETKDAYTRRFLGL
ncbi:MAG TPA: hypothetical protein ENN09_01885 [Planctomycetes bacterium]|nr:hypothetical protein [Planctomycetota bacterium]